MNSNFGPVGLICRFGFEADEAVVGRGRGGGGYGGIGGGRFSSFFLPRRVPSLPAACI